MKKLYTIEEFDSGEEVPIELQEWVFRSSDGEMMDDNWSDYVNQYIVDWFDSTSDPIEYEVK